MTDQPTQQMHSEVLVSALEDWIKQEVHREVVEHLSSSHFLQALEAEITRMTHNAKGTLAHPHMERKHLE